MELKKGSRSGTKKKGRCQTELESYNNRNELTHCGKELHLAKDRPTRQLSSQLQAKQANEHREKSEPYSVSQRGREGVDSLLLYVYEYDQQESHNRNYKKVFHQSYKSSFSSLIPAQVEGRKRLPLPV